MPLAKYKKTKVAMGDKPKDTGYTKTSGNATAKRNCKAVGGTWKNGKCVGGVL